MQRNEYRDEILDGSQKMKHKIMPTEISIRRQKVGNKKDNRDKEGKDSKNKKNKREKIAGKHKK